jgi:hypothetical protein
VLPTTSLATASPCLPCRAHRGAAKCARLCSADERPGARAAAAERQAAAEREEALLAADAALLREFAENDQVTVDGVVIPATCAAGHQPVNE